MFSEKLNADDIKPVDNKWVFKRKLLIYVVFPTIIIAIVAAILIAILITKNNKKEEDLPPSIYLKNASLYLMADFKIDGNQVINTGLSNTSKLIDYKIKDGYFSGGQIRLNSDYPNCTIIAIAQYNRTSKQRLFESFAYYGGAIDFQELVKNSPRLIGIAYAGGLIDTSYVFPNHSYLNKYYNGKYLVEGEDIFFALSTNGLNDQNGGKFYVQVNEDYHEKNRWCERVRKTFNVSTEHQFKEIKIYNTQLPKRNVMELFNKTKIKLNDEIYSIENFKEVDNGIDNSKYESLHIINKINTLYFPYKYGLAAFPYPYDRNAKGKADQYDVNWESSDESIAKVVDGLVMPKKCGKVTITAKLLRTKITDSVTIEIIERKKPKEKRKTLSKGYKSKKGNTFTSSNTSVTTQAIHDAIYEAFNEGYNYVVFPKIDFIVSPIAKRCYIPTGMTVEFPKGSRIFMKPKEKPEYGSVFFGLGWPTWEGGYFHNIPKDIATVERNPKTGNITGYYIDDAHLIVDKYYGEFYNESSTYEEIKNNAKKYDSNFVVFGKFARYCSAEVHTANCTAGYFMLMAAQTYSNEIKGNIGISYLNFTKGRINDKGELDSSVSRWFSTSGFYEIGKREDGTDFYENYVLTNMAHKTTAYHTIEASSLHLYDIAWYDENKKFLKVDRFRFMDENYVRGEGAKYYKISMHQIEQPKMTDCNDNKTYVIFMPAGSSHFCEIRNTNIFHSAKGLFAFVGETNSCWIHDNYLYNDGYVYPWSMDLEDGWYGMRGTIIENNVIRKRSVDYTGPDTGYLYLSGGFNTFVINNYLGALCQGTYNTANSHVIHNTIGCLFGYFNHTTQQFHLFRSSLHAHIYNNVLGCNNTHLHAVSTNGVVYLSDNFYDKLV